MQLTAAEFISSVRSLYSKGKITSMIVLCHLTVSVLLLEITELPAFYHCNCLKYSVMWY